MNKIINKYFVVVIALAAFSFSVSGQETEPVTLITNAKIFDGSDIPNYCVLYIHQPIVCSKT